MISSKADSYHRPDIQERSIISLVLWHTFDSPLLDMELCRESLELCVQAVALHKGFSRHRAFIGIRASSHALLLHILFVVLERHCWS